MLAPLEKQDRHNTVNQIDILSWVISGESSAESYKWFFNTFQI